MGACTGSQRQKFESSRNLMSYKVLITAYIWNKNAHNLFDFENNQSTKREIEVDFQANIATVDNFLVALTKQEQIRGQADLFQLNCEPKEVSFSQISSQQDHRIWAIVRQNGSNSEFESLNNDIIKLGRVRVQLNQFEIVPPGQMLPLNPPEEAEGLDDQECESVDGEGESLSCKVCFSHKATASNPLMRPCKCTGSVKYIHLKCLQNWIIMHVKVKNSDNCTMYIWKRMECEICKSAFKTSYTFQDRVYSILNIPRPQSSYIMMNITNDEKGKEGMIYVLQVGEKRELKIGRIPECEIKLKDISVSRQHAIINIIPVPDETNPTSYILRLTDNNSKFGTLVLAQSDVLKKFKIPQSPEQSKTLYQIGRVLINIQLKPKSNNKGSTYKHPSHLINQSVQGDQFVQKDKDVSNQCSFQTNNELNVSDIIINDMLNKKEPEPNQNKIDMVDFDMVVSDEHNQPQ